MIKSFVAALVMSAALAVTAFPAQVGDEVRSEVTARVSLPDNQVREIVHVNLDKSIWQIGFYERDNDGSPLVAGAINTSVDLGGRGDALFHSEDTESGPAFMGMALGSRTVTIDVDGTPVYLVGYNLGTPAPPVQSFVFSGFLSAIKIKN